MWLPVFDILWVESPGFWGLLTCMTSLHMWAECVTTDHIEPHKWGDRKGTCFWSASSEWSPPSSAQFQGVQSTSPEVWARLRRSCHLKEEWGCGRGRSKKLMLEWHEGWNVGLGGRWESQFPVSGKEDFLTSRAARLWPRVTHIPFRESAQLSYVGNGWASAGWVRQEPLIAPVFEGQKRWVCIGNSPMYRPVLWVAEMCLQCRLNPGATRLKNPN